eukprot:1924465-Rhodomonas_salina.2
MAARLGAMAAGAVITGGAAVSFIPHPVAGSFVSLAPSLPCDICGAPRSVSGWKPVEEQTRVDGGRMRQELET